MTPYNIVLFLHLASMAGLFVGYGLEWIVSSLLRRATTADQARAWLRVYRFSLPVSGPARFGENSEHAAGGERRLPSNVVPLNWSMLEP